LRWIDSRRDWVGSATAGYVRFAPESGHMMKTIGIVLIARWGCQRHRDNYDDFA